MLNPDRAQAVPGLVWAFRIHADGAAEELNVDEPLDDRHDGWLWLHFNLADARTDAFLRSLPELPPAAIDALLGKESHQRLHAADACVYGVIADLSRALEGVREQVGLLHFVMTERYLISGRRQALNAVQATRQKLKSGHRLGSVAALLELIVEHIAEAIDDLTADFGIRMDEIEEDILDSGTRDERQTLGEFRRTTVRLHRQIAGLNALFHRLEQRGPGELKPALRLEAGRLSQRLEGLDREVGALHDRARVLQEEISNLLAEETNRHLRALTMVTILFLPPTLIAGFFGMNLEGLPFASSEVGFWGGVIAGLIASTAVYGLLRWFGINSR